ncbi:unnamed protein product [Ixodes pacificus]
MQGWTFWLPVSCPRRTGFGPALGDSGTLLFASALVVLFSRRPRVALYRPTQRAFLFCLCRSEIYDYTAEFTFVLTFEIKMQHGDTNHAESSSLL